MKYIYSEAQNEYSNYLFSYQVFLLKEEFDSIEQIYDSGFLPVRSIKDLFYLSRSSRVNLDKFELSSENRRVLKKTAEVNLHLIPINEFNYNNSGTLQKEYLSEIALRRIFSARGNYSHVFNFDNRGFAVTRITENLIHYAHQFFSDKTYGMSGMTSIVKYAKEQGKKYVYLGTCYGKNSLYKAQFAGFEFFDGITWSDDLDKLKYLINGDNQMKKTHLFQDEKYLSLFYNERKLGRVIKKLQNAK